MSKTSESDSILYHLYIPIEDVEKLERYKVGGYHPITIEDQFHDSYRIVQKLGHGSYSTIWLAQDERCNEIVAIKVPVQRIQICTNITCFPTFPARDSFRAIGRGET
ncbi:hypothetical protein BGW36DRAFT_376018 [Talaromyces proteolyticus]|uniref:non-specific serine/threonine protein kinase n=1 Tax=Talaromyces proteolyticus TaxID=1131652 RepID=A0AAD4KWD2_9EURO|nr:uncharacterized protein BGW36DRAFT_376018 [Talaromyces proteolyticus]KAH8698407.1 hypothetical protein BGW36DRAFT_376018 [Talaromyces proteolyticus]